MYTLVLILMVNKICMEPCSTVFSFAFNFQNAKYWYVIVVKLRKINYFLKYHMFNNQQFLKRAQ